MTRPRYPAAPQVGIANTIHGQLIPDPWRWLEADDLAVWTWADQQDCLARRSLGVLPHRNLLAGHLQQWMSVPERSVPSVRGNRYYYLEKTSGFGPAALWVATDSHPPEVVVDPTRWAESGTAVLAAWSVSDDGRRLAFQISEGGSDHTTLRVVDTATKQVMAQVDGLRSSSMAWDHSSPSGLFYCRSVAVGTAPGGLWYLDLESSASRLVWQPGRADLPVFAVPAVSAPGDRLLLNVRYGADSRNELVLLGVHRSPAGRIELGEARSIVAPGVQQCLARFCPDGSVYVLSRQSLELSDSPPSVSEGLGRLRRIATACNSEIFRGCLPLDGHLLMWRERSGVGAVDLIDTKSGVSRPVPLPGSGAVTGVSATESPRRRAWIRFADPVTSPTIVEIDLGKSQFARSELWFNSASGAAACDVQRYRTFGVSHDGTRIPISVWQQPGRPAPTILSVYGGFGVVSDLDFNPVLLAWLQAGGSYAVAHVRGGGDSPGWHDAGRRRLKLRSIEDLIAAGEHLIDTKVVNSHQIGVFGASNGGLLALAAVVRRPELFRCCVAAHPVTDMIRYPHLGDGRSWVAEYGDPADPEDFRALWSYSPYHRLQRGAEYPPVLLMAGRADHRVPPAHARKFAAAMQHVMSEDYQQRPVLLREEERSGHGRLSHGAVIPWLTDRLSFFAAYLGLPQPAELVAPG